VRVISLQRTDPRTGETTTQTLKVRIPAGVREGQIIRVAGMGEDGIGQGGSGDLYLRVRLAAHPDFQVRSRAANHRHYQHRMKYEKGARGRERSNKPDCCARERDTSLSREAFFQSNVSLNFCC
jgi:DnaJ C terminal domain